MLDLLTRDFDLSSFSPWGEILPESLRRKNRRNMRTSFWPQATVASVPSSNFFVFPADTYELDWKIPYAAVSGAIAVEVGDLCYDYGSSSDVAYPAGQMASQGSLAADQALFTGLFVGCSLDKVLASETNAARRFTVMTRGIKVFDCPSQTWDKGDLIGIYSDGSNSPIAQKVDKVTTVDKAIGVCIKSSAGVSVTTVTAMFVAKNYTGQRTAGTTLGDVTLNSIVSGDSSLGIAGQTAAQGGAIAMVGGTSSTSGNAGGAITLTGGTPGATGVGGAISITGGAGGATSGAGGAITITGGAGTAGNGDGGAVTIKGGEPHGSGLQGTVSVQGLIPTAGTTAVAITAATALKLNDSGGIFTVSQAAAYDIDLPSPTVGAGVRFLFQLVAPGANAVTITVLGGAATFEGVIHIDGTTIVATGSTLTFASGASALGDYIEAISTATGKYFIRAMSSAAGGITIA